MQKRLTVSIAAYNVEEYIEKALRSCVVPLNIQKYLEIIIVNDGSTDGTWDIIQKYLQEYPELFVGIDKENGGYGSTINAALEKASGKYFRLLDGDDYFDRDALCSFVECLENTEADVVLNDFSIYYEKQNCIEKRELCLKDGIDQNASGLDMKNKVAMYSFCYKTEILKKYQICIDENCFYTDIEFITRPLRYIESYRYIRNNLYQYRIGREGQSISKIGMKRHYLDAQKVTYSVLSELQLEYKYENIRETVKLIAGIMVKMTLKSMMCVEVSNSNRKKIMQFDKEIKKKFPEVYLYIDRSCLFFLLRRTRYWIYPLWRLI